MSEFAGKLHQFALSWDLWVISRTPLMLPGPSFRRHCTAFSYLYDDRPSECRHLSDLSLSVDLRGQDCGSMLQTSGLGCCCMGIPTCRMLACAFVKSSPPCFSEPLCLHVCVQCWGRGAVCFCSWLPEKHPAHASAAALVRQWQRCLAFRARGQGGASHHLPTKAQVTQPASALPHFLHPPTAHLTPLLAQLRKLRGLLPFFPLLISPGTPLQSLSFHGTVLSSLLEEANCFFLLLKFARFLKILCPHVSVWTKGWQHLPIKSSKV